ncbi:E3 ubiquitin-protein ligase RNF126-like [Cydia pomonella]|uniref:E3 ubiquitin-protein ligase RNF126-like n=1 Tax=Cydia pomonella TaxID=82600 RepID=UPI002ADD720D|nr:E3 ubiquitin-protein ligase RNF126-like [Cydia pomonella]
MADAVVERRPPARFFCHRCNIEFEDVLQDYRCPYCASGFIEQLESETEGSALSGDDFSDADMSNLDDSDDTHQSASHPMLSDLAFLMSGGRHRGGGRPETLLEQLVYSISGSGPLGGAAVTAGAPFVLVGAPGDYVFGGEGLDAVVTQLLGQLENAGPPPLPREQIAAIPSEAVTEEQAAANTSCSVCWENFQMGEMVSKLQCEHIFHSTCIEPWLQLHATCPICRRSLLTEEPPAEPGAEREPPAPPPRPSSTMGGMPTVRLRRLARRRAPGAAWDAAADSSSSSDASVTAGGLWAGPRGDSTSTSSLNSAATDASRDNMYNMDIDFD